MCPPATRPTKVNATEITEQLLQPDNATYEVGTWTFQYDALNRLTVEKRTGAHPYWYEYVMDPAGNRTQFVEKDGQGQVLGTTNATYSDDNRLLTYGNTSYTWDQNGNQTAKTTNGALGRIVSGPPAVIPTKGAHPVRTSGGSVSWWNEGTAIALGVALAYTAFVAVDLGLWRYDVPARAPMAHRIWVCALAWLPLALWTVIVFRAWQRGRPSWAVVLGAGIVAPASAFILVSSCFLVADLVGMAAEGATRSGTTAVSPGDGLGPGWLLPLWILWDASALRVPATVQVVWAMGTGLAVAAQLRGQKAKGPEPSCAGTAAAADEGDEVSRS